MSIERARCRKNLIYIYSIIRYMTCILAGSLCTPPSIAFATEYVCFIYSVTKPPTLTKRLNVSIMCADFQHN